MAQTTPDTAPHPPRRGRGLVIALATSLALNLAVAGGLAGAFLIHGFDDDGAAALRDPGLGPLGAAFSHKDRDAMRGAFAGRRDELRRSFADDRADAAALAQVLRTEPYDAAAVSAVFGRMRQRAHGRIDAGLATVEKHVAGLGPAERADLAQRIEDALARAPRPRWRMHDHTP